MYTSDWVEKEFTEAPFADERAVKRLMELARSFFSNPQGSIPEACGSYSATRAAYRFFSNSKIKPEAILMSHREQTIERMKKYTTVLALQDTTSLDYRGHLATEGLGLYSMSSEALGLKVHTTLAVTTDGLPLGHLARYVWTRDPEEYGKHHTRNKRAIPDKESQRWLDALDESLHGIPQYINVVTVCDREADIFEFFNKAVTLKKDLLVRVNQNRRVLEDGKYLVQEIESKPVNGELKVMIPRDPENKRPPREAKLAIRYCPVTIKPPLHQLKPKSLPNLNLYLILAEEVSPPEGVEPIYWLLLTTLPIEDLNQAIEKIQWYKQRWKIERYHLVLKSGCKVEELQLESVDNLQNALALYSIIAWKLLWIKLESEQNPETPCTTVLEGYEWQVLYCAVHRTTVPPVSPPTLQEAVMLLGKLGGFLGRRRDGNPGVKAIWRGLRRLDDIIQGWLIARLPTNSQ